MSEMYKESTKNLLYAYKEELGKISDCPCSGFSSGIKLTGSKKCYYCREYEKMEEKFTSCHPLYQSWNQPSQDSIGVFINLKCGHRGNYNDKEKKVLCHWMKEGGFSNEDPYFLNFTDDLSESGYGDDSSDSLTPPNVRRKKSNIRRNSHTPEKSSHPSQRSFTPEIKSSKQIPGSPFHRSLIQDEEED